MDHIARFTVRGGRIVDPAWSRNEVRDLTFEGGVVSASRFDSSEADISARGCLVVPGLIDFHGHFYTGGFPFGLDPDAHAAESGVVAVVDAGSAGWANFGGFESGVIERAVTRTYAFLNLSAIGLASRSVGIGELEDSRYADVPNAVALLGSGTPRLLGMKLRLTDDCGPVETLREGLVQSREIVDATGTRLMVHVCGSPIPMDEVLSYLRAGDIVTHYLHGGENSMLDDRGSIRGAAHEARGRGVMFEVGHGGIHVDHGVAEAAASEGFWPDIISTDAHLAPPSRDVPSLPDMLSMFLTQGMPLADVVAAVTSVPAAIIADPQLSGTLEPGIGRHATMLGWVDRPRTFTDARGRELTVPRTLEVRGLIRDGVVVDLAYQRSVSSGAPTRIFDAVSGQFVTVEG